MSNAHRNAMLQSFKRKWVVANQTSERWFSYVKKMIRPIKIANDVFSRVRKMILPTISQREFRAKIPAFHRRLHLAVPLRRHSTRDILEEVFLENKSEKPAGKLSETVSFLSLSMKKTVERRQHNRTIAEGEKLMFKPAILLMLKFIYLILNCAFRKNR